MEAQKLKIGRAYRHFKGDYYLLLGTAKFSTFISKGDISQIKKQIDTALLFDRVKYSEDEKNQCEFLIFLNDGRYEIIADQNNPDLPEDKKVDYHITYVIYSALYPPKESLNYKSVCIRPLNHPEYGFLAPMDRKKYPKEDFPQEYRFELVNPTSE